MAGEPCNIKSWLLIVAASFCRLVKSLLIFFFLAFVCFSKDFLFASAFFLSLSFQVPANTEVPFLPIFDFPSSFSFGIAFVFFISSKEV